ncbi:MAG: hypothetical protein WC866_02225 [Patescibacteria group bacterium]|jgi:hypothetical protein
MFKQLSTKTRLVIVGTALLAVAVFAVLSFMDRGNNGAPYIPNYPYMPPQPIGPGIKPTETAKGPFACGEEPASISAELIPEGWTAENNQYLCLSMRYPEGWQLAMPRNIKIPDGMHIPISLGFQPKESMMLYPANIYPIATNSVIPKLGKALEDVRTSNTNIGSKDMEVYELGGKKYIDENGADIVSREYVLYAPSVDKAYYVDAAYFPEVMFDGTDITPYLLDILKASRAY